MPCFAVTNTKAKIANQFISDLLTDEVVENVATSVLNLLPGVNFTKSSYGWNKEWIADYSISGYDSYTLGIGRNETGIVVGIQARTDLTKAQQNVIDAIETAIQIAGAQIAGTTLAKSLRNAGATVTDAQTLQNGTFEVSFELDI